MVYDELCKGYRPEARGYVIYSPRALPSSFAGAENDQAVDNFNQFAPRIFRPTGMFTDKEDSGRGITT